MFTPAPGAKRRAAASLYVSPLKALAVDVERNLRAPLAGIARVADERGDRFVTPAIAIRTGDTPAAERARFQREPADILITTPESLYLLLTSNAREALRVVDTIIIDEIHALVPTKRGAHLALSLERLAARCERPPQRIGLSATQRPLDEVARFLGGVEAAGSRQSNVGRPQRAQATRPRPTRPTSEIDDRVRSASRRPLRYRPVTIVDAGAKKALKLTIEVPVEDMARLTTADDIPSGPASVGDDAAVDLVGDPPAAARADSRASLDADLRQQPAARRAAGRRAQRAGGRDARALAPRIDRARAARRGRRPAEGRRACARWSPPRRSSSASTWARSISSSRSRRRRRWPAGCSASAAAATRSTRSAKA